MKNWALKASFSPFFFDILTQNFLLFHYFRKKLKILFGAPHWRKYTPSHYICFISQWSGLLSYLKSTSLKGVFAKNERGYRLNAIKKLFWSLLILLISVASIRRKLIKTSHTEERSAHTNWGSWNIRRS